MAEIALVVRRLLDCVAVVELFCTHCGVSQQLFPVVGDSGGCASIVIYGKERRRFRRTGAGARGCSRRCVVVGCVDTDSVFAGTGLAGVGCVGARVVGDRECERLPVVQRPRRRDAQTLTASPRRSSEEFLRAVRSRSRYAHTQPSSVSAADRSTDGWEVSCRPSQAWCRARSHATAR